MLGAILVPKEIGCFNPLISKGLLETRNFVGEEKVPSFVSKNYLVDDEKPETQCSQQN